MSLPAVSSSASSTRSLFFSPIPTPNSFVAPRRGYRRRYRAPFMASSGDRRPTTTRLVTFLGKGGSGKTTAAVLAAQYYAMEGLRTCLVIHSQDPTADQVLGCKIQNSMTECNNNLSAIRLETSKMLLEPLNRMKKVDSRLNFTQGVLDGVVGEELGVLPGMDSIFSALSLQKLVNFIPGERNLSNNEFDIVVYDGISTEETLRLIGATERARWYLKYLRSMAEKTDIGRLTAPSLLKLVYESARITDGSTEGKTSTQIWDDIEIALESASVSFRDPSKLGCYLVIDPKSSTSISAALRYWGCAIQAGTQICGAFGFASPSSEMPEELWKSFSQSSFAMLPYLPLESSVDWNTKLSSMDANAKELLGTTNKHIQTPLKFDSSQKSVTLFMPGFDKSEIKLFQYRGGSELLVEAGDQRRVIKLPREMHGRVSSAKFIDRNLIVTLR